MTTEKKKDSLKAKDVAEEIMEEVQKATAGGRLVDRDFWLLTIAKHLRANQRDVVLLAMNVLTKASSESYGKKKPPSASQLRLQIYNKAIEELSIVF